jgi:cytoskeletal protein RodZ
LNNNLKLVEEINLEEFKKNLIIARENKNLSIKEASQTLNISEDIIKKLEDGDFNEISNDIFILGHIRTYLNLIEINPKLLINDNIAKTINLKNNTHKIILPYKFKLSRFYILLVSVISLFLLLIIYKNLNKLNKENIIYNKENKTEELNKEIALANKLDEIEAQVPIKIDQTDLKNIDNAELLTKEEVDITITESNEKDISEIKTIDFIHIEAIADSWIEIQNKNSKILVSKIIKKDEKIKLPYEEDLTLVTGNAGGIIIQINGNKINNIGSSGEVKRNISLNFENLIKFIEE